MAVKGARTIAEYAIRKWLESGELEPGRFDLVMIGQREAVIRNGNGDEMYLEYDPVSKMVIPTEI